MPDDPTDPDARRRALIASVLVGGATYALPVVASLGGTRPASAAGTSGPETGGGRPDHPGTQGNGSPQRPADPGEGGLGRNTGDNPHHGDTQQDSEEPGRSGDRTGASTEEEAGYFDGIGPGGRGFA
ncbi:hypothetical protein HKCCSP123_14195 [Rhodobacterales bacterium HKCCSP123]|nr:hypothetical protein [Rhodobacterales bacterium HKCCSP123]